MESGYLFRVMQGIADAATTLGAVRVASLARAAEQFYTSIRVHPNLVNAAILQLATTTNETLQTLVTTLGQPEEFESDIESLVSQMQKATSRYAKAG